MNIFSAGYYYYEQNLMKKIIKSKGEINPSYINDDIDSLINNDDNEDIIINDKNNEIKEKKIKVNNISITQFSSENDNNGTKKENVSNKFIRDSSSFFIEINNFPKEKIKEPNNKGKVMGRYNGYYISYIIAFLIAIIVRIFSNQEDIITEHKYLYFNLIKFHFAPILISLFFYMIFSCAFTKNEDNKSEICMMEFCGYLIFKKTKAKKKIYVVVDVE